MNFKKSVPSACVKYPHFPCFESSAQFGEKSPDHFKNHDNLKVQTRSDDNSMLFLRVITN